ncbi:TetR/AcrR family transcriptional regulator [Melghirimyces algeriensis]|uniref:Transcriptional regulator, TetR family n=1 Tax=Melghirimyces algeriensis TaxID=910412 RepID=A0A521BNX7_9BACL|nr:TetR/AcrR family transcriptional regulator [Melghirimyces algeriensis]SMO48844.1 transcriptional regulator, TetR family [Melghirimyces algeriensis]
MSKKQTRQTIIEKSVPLFNQQGFSGVSMSDIMSETGLQKGGIYNHFDSKETLALEAFDHAVNMAEHWFEDVVKGQHTAEAKLFAFIQSFREYVRNPPVPGGCPLVNTAVDSDDQHPTLREKARQAMDRSRQWLIAIIRDGIEEGTIRSDTDPDVLATLITASFEGALVMSRLYDDPIHMDWMVDHLCKHLQTHFTTP